MRNTDSSLIKLIPVRMKNVNKEQPETKKELMSLPLVSVIYCSFIVRENDIVILHIDNECAESAFTNLDNPVILVECPVKLLFDTVDIDSNESMFLFLYDSKLYQAIDDATYQLFKELYGSNKIRPTLNSAGLSINLTAN